MLKKNHAYLNPLGERYGSPEMSYLFSPQYKFSTWRKLWLYLAEAQKEAGLKITQKQIGEMKKHLEDIDFDEARRKEKELRHDVMAHVHAFAKQCPHAAPIIHLGVTSAFVGDNTDLIQIKEAMELVKNKLLLTLHHLKEFSLCYKELPTLSYTHFQPAQPTTVGKRACLWLQEFLIDFNQLIFFLEENLYFRGIKGTTGTQASFKQLLGDDVNKINKIEKYIANKFGFKKCFIITGQTYTRKLDYQVSSLLSSIAQSASKFANDIRLLSHKKEIEEPFEKNQIGSSAMAYKRNPMRSERINSLARFVIALPFTTAYTASSQWFERTLDDSANKRLAIPQAFLATDAILDLVNNIVSGMHVHEKVVNKNLMEEFPFMVTENIIMESVKKGENRQAIHEVIRKLSWQVGEEVKNGQPNRLIEMMINNKDIPLNRKEINQLINVKDYVGFSSELTESFLKKQVNPIFKKYSFKKKSSNINV